MIHPNSASLNQWIPAVYKKRWVSITIRYDDFFKFLLEFIIPVSNEMLTKQVASSFYYRLGVAAEQVVQIKLTTTQFNLDTVIKPHLFEELERYFGKEFLLELGIEQINENILERKYGLESLDLKSVKLVGLEEYYIDPITFSIGVPGARLLSELATKSSRIIIDDINETKNSWTIQNSIEKSLALNYPTLYILLKDTKEIVDFLSWVTATLLNQIKEVKEDVSLEQYQSQIIQEMEDAFLHEKEGLVDYTNYILESMKDEDVFEDEWLNEWVNELLAFKNQLQELDIRGLLPTHYDLSSDVNDEKTIFHSIDDKTYQRWQIVYYIINTMNGQLGLGFSYEFNVFYMMKRSVGILMEEEALNS